MIYRFKKWFLLTFCDNWEKPVFVELREIFLVLTYDGVPINSERTKVLGSVFIQTKKYSKEKQMFVVAEGIKRHIDPNAYKLGRLVFLN